VIDTEFKHKAEYQALELIQAKWRTPLYMDGLKASVNLYVNNIEPKNRILAKNMD